MHQRVRNWVVTLLGNGSHLGTLLFLAQGTTDSIAPQSGYFAVGIQLVLIDLVNW